MIKKSNLKAGEIHQWQRTHFALAEDLRSLSASTPGSSHFSVTPTPEDPTPSYGLQGLLHSWAQTLFNKYLGFEILSKPAIPLLRI